MTAPLDNPFTDHEVVASYEGWYETAGRRADELEKQLLDELLVDLPAIETVLEVGCGTGHFSRWFEARGLHVVGVDLSMEMLLESRRLTGPHCVRSRAERLPFASKSIDLVALITTLEFVADVGRSLSEACRVARRGILVGALNRHSLLGRALQKRADTPWTSGSLYTVRELRKLVMRAAGEYRPKFRSRTTLWPGWWSSLPLPWGGFIGINATWR
jgi:ubiquinone/menaquinone biosynthesis C-methylase UbiE